MANTYNLISATTLSSDNSSIVFNSIPTTYTDLVIELSLRHNQAGNDRFHMILNNDTGANYSLTMIYYDGANRGSLRRTANNNFYFGWNTVSGFASNFSSSEIYIPNYNSAIKHQVSSVSYFERNESTAYMAHCAGLHNVAQAVTSVEIKSPSYSFVSGSTFYLYGISKT